jgi:hypothetical protein
MFSSWEILNPSPAAEATVRCAWSKGSGGFRRRGAHQQRKAAALGIVDHLRCRFGRFNLCAHFLDLGRLLVETRSKLRNRCTGLKP